MKRVVPAVTFIAVLALLACSDDDGASPATPTGSVSGETPAVDATATAPPDEPDGVRVPNTGPALELSLPEGFTAYRIAEGFLRATSIALGPDGELFVSERHGNVYRLADADGDGVYEELVLYSSGYEEATGIVVAEDGTLYVSSRGIISTVRDADGDGVGEERNDIITGLPIGRHQNDGIVFGPDGKLYIGHGSTCDDCVEPDDRSPTILQANADGSGLRIYATGLRNVYDMAFDAQGNLWATDNGSDTPCETVDELNLIEDGGDYGWPYGEEGCDPLNDGIPPVVSLGLHTASTGITAYEADHFPGFAGTLFATVWGSFFATPDPYDRVLLHIDHETAVVTEFASGFQHPIDVLAGSDGTLLVLDYGSDSETDGVLYRVVYTGS
jgi:glucose/arabinose dehydrogenase